MSEKSINTSLSSIVKSVAANTEVLNSIQSNDGQVKELLNVIYQRVEDMSKKFDEVLINDDLKIALKEAEEMVINFTKNNNNISEV